MSKFFKIKSEQIKPATPKPTMQPATGYQWSWNVDTAQWEQVPINSQYSYNITDNKNTVSTTNTNTTATYTTGYTTASLDNYNEDLKQYIKDVKKYLPLEYNNIKQEAQGLLNLIDENLEVVKVRLNGSYYDGIPTENSDIDILVFYKDNNKNPKDTQEIFDELMDMTSVILHSKKFGILDVQLQRINNNITASLKDSDNIIACLSQFINVDDFNDGILFVNGLEHKPSNQMYENGLVKYAGYDFMNGSMVKITPKGLDYIKNFELDNYNRLKKQIESSIGDTTDVPSTIPGFDFPCEGIRPEDGAYDTDNKKFADFEKQSIKWYNIELEKDEAEKLKLFLKENKVKYEVSEVERNGKNIIHFEMQLRPELLEKVSSYIDNNIKIFKKANKDEDIMSAKEMNHIIDILENKYYNEIYDAFENQNLDKKLKEILINEDLRVDDTTFGRIVEYFDVLFL